MTLPRLPLEFLRMPEMELRRHRREQVAELILAALAAHGGRARPSELVADTGISPDVICQIVHNCPQIRVERASVRTALGDGKWRLAFVTTYVRT